MTDHTTPTKLRGRLAIQGALKKLGFSTWPVKGEGVVEQRQAMYVDLKQYASFRAAGMSQDDAMAALADDLFGASSEEE